MSSLIIAIICIPELFTIEKDNKTIGGALGPGYRYTLYPLLLKFDYKLVCRDLTTSNYCGPEGSCYGTLREMQLGNYHFAGLFSHLQLLSPELINLTIGPTTYDKQCFITYPPKIKVEQDISDIGTVLESFGPTYWLSYSTAICVHSITMILINDNPLEKKSELFFISRLLRKLFSVILTICCLAIGHGNVQPRTKRIIEYLISACLLIFFSLTIWLFCAEYIFNVSIRHDFIKLDTLTDVTDSGYSVSTLYGSCQQVIDATNGSILAPYKSSVTTFDSSKLGVKALAEKFVKQRNVFITEWINVVRARVLLYENKIDGMDKRLIYSSVDPVYSLIEYAIISKSLGKHGTRKFMRYWYASFETGNKANHLSTLFDRKSLSKGKLCYKCFESVRPTKENMITSISLAKLFGIFKITTSLYFITIGVFIVELVAGRKNS